MACFTSYFKGIHKMEGASSVPLAVAHVRRFRSLLPAPPPAPSDGELGEAEPVSAVVTVPEDLAPEGAADPAPAPAPDAVAAEPAAEPALAAPTKNAPQACSGRRGASVKD